MAWTAVAHLRASPMALPNDPAVIGIDREFAAALACFVAVPGLMWPRTRKAVALAIMMGIVYMVSARRLAATLDGGALVLLPLFAAALLVWWPQLTKARNPDG